MAVAMDAMAVAIHIKYALSQNIHLIFYYSAPSAGRNNRTKALECIRLIDELM